MTRAAIPRAEIAPGPLRRLWRWLRARAAAPEWLRDLGDGGAAVFWSASGAIAAGVVTGFIVYVASGTQDLDLPTSIGWVTVMVLGGLLVLFLPFLFSYLGWTLLRRAHWARRRLAGALYGAAFHIGAQALVELWLLGHLVAPMMIIAPLVIGSLWGSWLPATYTKQPRT